MKYSGFDESTCYEENIFFFANVSQAHSFLHYHPARRRAQSGSVSDFRDAFPHTCPSSCAPCGFSPALEKGARHGIGAASSIPGMDLCLQLPVPVLPVRLELPVLQHTRCHRRFSWQVALPTRPNAPAGTASTLFPPFPLLPRVLQIPRAKNTAGAGNQAAKPPGMKWCLK